VLREVLMTMIEGATNWRSHGACVSADPDLFFPVSSGGASRRQEERAKAVCSRCAVQAECLSFAVESRQVHGVWGGLGEEELARLRRSRHAASGRPQPERIPGTGRVAVRGRAYRQGRQHEPQDG
jgi:WhiB family redox-sensing transcriptional regulator